MQVSRYEGMKAKYIFLITSTKKYSSGTQKNRLDETVLLSPQNICLDRYG